MCEHDLTRVKHEPYGPFPSVANIPADRGAHGGKVRPDLVLAPGNRPRLDEEPIDLSANHADARLRRVSAGACRHTAVRLHRERRVDGEVGRPLRRGSLDQGDVDLLHFPTGERGREPRVGLGLLREEHAAGGLRVEAMVDEDPAADVALGKGGQAGACRIRGLVSRQACGLVQREEPLVLEKDRGRRHHSGLGQPVQSAHENRPAACDPIPRVTRLSARHRHQPGGDRLATQTPRNRPSEMPLEFGRKPPIEGRHRVLKDRDGNRLHRPGGRTARSRSRSRVPIHRVRWNAVTNVPAAMRAVTAMTTLPCRNP